MNIGEEGARLLLTAEAVGTELPRDWAERFGKHRLIGKACLTIFGFPPAACGR